MKNKSMEKCLTITFILGAKNLKKRRPIQKLLSIPNVAQEFTPCEEKQNVRMVPHCP
jgi:hypothetical protein